MPDLKNVPCGCNGHSHCPKCGGTGKSGTYIVTHPMCKKNGCKGMLYPKDHIPGAPLKCDKCGRIVWR